MSKLSGTSTLGENVLHFARALRHAGLPVGPGKILAAVEAAAWVGIEHPDDLRAALAATLIDREDQRALFEQAFKLFWRDPALLARAMQLSLPPVAGRLAPGTADTAPSTLDTAQSAPAPAEDAGEGRDRQVELDCALTYSAKERLQSKDFEAMTVEELAAAKRMLQTLRLPLPDIATRRYGAHPSGPALDMRATLRRSLRHGGEWIVQRRRKRRKRPADLVVLCDISGSMSRYSRMLLQFLHGLAADGRRLHAFTFGTRLTNISRALRQRHVDRALGEMGRMVPDWAGGTRIGDCLHEFNRDWSRRVLSQGAVVLLISDGLDCGEGADLALQMARVHASARSIVWLNPLLRFDGFEPRAAGIRAMLPHVDRFLPAHNITSLRALGRVLESIACRDGVALHTSRPLAPGA